MHRITLIPGDGIGPEIMREAVAALNRIGEIFNRAFVFSEADAGGAAIDKHGEPLPADTVALCRGSDAVLLGAVGGWQWEHLPGDKRPERALLGLREALGLYANLRPAVLHPSLKEACPLRTDIADRGIDIMIVRELTGGMYFGERGRKQTGEGQAAWDTETYSEPEIRRIAAVAFDIARKRKKILTSVDKANVLESSRLWREVVITVAKHYPDVRVNHLYVDNAAMQLIRDPSQFDVVLTTNMFGDILSDEASQLTGSIGMLPSASMGSGRFGLFEPIHGSAPNIAGKGIANPIAMVLSAAMMLRHALGLEAEAAAVEAAVAAALDAGCRTADIMSEGMSLVGTTEMGKLIIGNLHNNRKTMEIS
jgi:3-isopropylmalate dehydrogenase